MQNFILEYFFIKKLMKLTPPLTIVVSITYIYTCGKIRILLLVEPIKIQSLSIHKSSKSRRNKMHSFICLLTPRERTCPRESYRAVLVGGGKSDSVLTRGCQRLIDNTCILLSISGGYSGLMSLRVSVPTSSR